MHFYPSVNFSSETGGSLLYEKVPWPTYRPAFFQKDKDFHY